MITDNKKTKNKLKGAGPSKYGLMSRVVTGNYPKKKSPLKKPPPGTRVIIEQTISDEELLRRGKRFKPRRE